MSQLLSSWSDQLRFGIPDGIMHQHQPIRYWSLIIHDHSNYGWPMLTMKIQHWNHQHPAANFVRWDPFQEALGSISSAFSHDKAVPPGSQLQENAGQSRQRGFQTPGLMTSAFKHFPETFETCLTLALVQCLWMFMASCQSHEGLVSNECKPNYRNLPVKGSGAAIPDCQVQVTATS